MATKTLKALKLPALGWTQGDQIGWIFANDVIDHFENYTS
jgi:hypothetical protein